MSETVGIVVFSFAAGWVGCCAWVLWLIDRHHL